MLRLWQVMIFLISFALTSECQNQGFCNPSSDCETGFEAKYWTEYPGVGATSESADAKAINIDYHFQRCSPIKYDDCNDLPWKTNVPNTNPDYGTFNFDPLTERQSYAKVFGWYTLMDLNGGNAIQFDVTNTTNIFGWDSFREKLLIGISNSGNAVAHERFFYAHALIDKEFGGIYSGLAYNGIEDFLAMEKLGRPHGQCNFYALQNFILNTNTIGINCSPGLDPQPRNFFSTYLTRCSEEIGVDKVKTIAKEMVANIVFQTQLNDFQLSIKNLYLTAAMMYEDNRKAGIDINDLCGIKNVLNTYFSDCINSTELYLSEDLYIQDDSLDIGIEPNLSNLEEWNSPSIINRYLPDSGLENQEVKANQQNTLYINVKKLGCDTIKDARLEVYFSLPQTGLSWDDAWKEKYLNFETNTILAGNKIGDVSIDSAFINNELRIPITYLAPSIKDFNIGKGTIHILARIVSEKDKMNADEIENLRINVRKNNNITWKVLTINE